MAYSAIVKRPNQPKRLLGKIYPPGTLAASASSSSSSLLVRSSQNQLSASSESIALTKAMRPNVLWMKATA